MDPAEEDIWYPTVEDILAIHADIVEEDPDATPGVRDADKIEFALEFVEGRVGEPPATIHEKAFHLMRLIASNHWFADANKRTALNATELFYLVNGYELDYGDDVRAMLTLFSVREELVDKAAGPAYLRDRTVELEFGDLFEGAPLDSLLTGIVADRSDPDLEEGVSESAVDPESIRERLGLTEQYGTTVNIGEEQRDTDDGG